ncbi:hypothetical protein [Calothrix sp. NIES-3974]|nr:hypothetical protein [Calothrix sp. NIES-3974]
MRYIASVWGKAFRRIISYMMVLCLIAPTYLPLTVSRQQQIKYLCDLCEF